MGRIPGWEKTIENDDWVGWSNGKGTIIMVINQKSFSGGELRGYSVEKRSRRDGNKILLNGSKMNKLKTKAEAQKFAIKWMRSHPNG